MNGIPMYCQGCMQRFGSMDQHQCSKESLAVWKDILDSHKENKAKKINPKKGK